METTNLKKSALLMLFIVIAAVASWEIYLRQKGFETTYNDDPSLWVNKRKMVYEPADKATVFTGSSRIKFDTDIETWESITGEHAIQLACVGSSPLPVLHNLANDEKFKGKLVVDVVEGIFFALKGSDRRPLENLKHFKEETPAQLASFHINHLLESQFVFLDKEWNSLGAYLDRIPTTDRPGIRNFRGFPSDFGRVKFNRQEYMTNKMAADTAIQNKVTQTWQLFGRGKKDPPITGKVLDSFCTAIKTSVDKIKARGGKVIFVRPPSTGSFLAAEKKFFPKEQYWDKLLSATGADGIYYADYPVMAALKCPEESHLNLRDAAIFTKELIRILKEEKGWFNK